MACGVAPITTRHTAMLDYIREDNAIIIRSERGSIDQPDTAVGPDPDARWHVCTSADVARALGTWPPAASCVSRRLPFDDGGAGQKWMASPPRKDRGAPGVKWMSGTPSAGSPGSRDTKKN